jgi:hypothetical protein
MLLGFALFASSAAADVVSDTITVTINGVDQNVPPIAEGREPIRIVVVPKADVPAKAVPITVELFEPGKDKSSPSDFIIFDVMANGDGQLDFTSDTNDFIVTPTLPPPTVFEDEGKVTDFTKDLFPNGAGGIVVKMVSDANAVPEPSTFVPLLTALAAFGWFRWRRRSLGR